MPHAAMPYPDNLPDGTVSVAIATYNGERYLRAQLDSLLAQSRLPDEVVIADDGSEDDTARICADFADRTPFQVRFLRNENNLGYTRNFQEALQQCRGDYVFICDQDDVWFDEKIEVMVAEMKRAPAKWLAIHDLRFCDADLRPTGQTKLQRIRWTADPERRYVTGMATVVWRDFLRCCLPVPDPEVITYDRWLHACALALDGKLIVDRVLADYRRHDTNVTVSKTVNTASSSPARMFLDPLRQSTRAVAVRVRLFEEVASWLARAEHRLLAAGFADPASFARRRSEWERIARLARQRMDHLARPRRARLASVLRLWSRGGYREFNGFKSVVVDLVRR